MDTKKWKSVAVDTENYKIITAMGEKVLEDQER